ncbi:low molecular weight phosphatase family protein [Thermus scotoductus]|uniref:Low molecular weight phosphatase family protein n=1 Tax=Thermus scotoductus TaxID=37636 RepID=A0A430UP06_THESC|nr:arsenate reductase ArsC [Thermus scotoductus]RTI08024.1 low molecular weight phosphatase family protein [Thermus scotoductus]
MRLLVLCTRNSARSQMAEGWLRHWAREMGVDLEVHSAGTEKTFVKEEAKRVMAEVGIDPTGHFSKTLFELPDPWNFHLVLTVCDAAKEACPAYPAKTEKRHVSFPDPSGKPVEEWRRVRDALGQMSRYLVENLKRGRIPTDEELREASGL